jgi:hypothetical protein
MVDDKIFTRPYIDSAGTPKTLKAIQAVNHLSDILRRYKTPA